MWQTVVHRAYTVLWLEIANGFAVIAVVLGPREPRSVGPWDWVLHYTRPTAPPTVPPTVRPTVRPTILYLCLIIWHGFGFIVLLEASDMV